MSSRKRLSTNRLGALLLAPAQPEPVEALLGKDAPSVSCKKKPTVATRKKPATARRARGRKARLRLEHRSGVGRPAVPPAAVPLHPSPRPWTALASRPQSRWQLWGDCLHVLLGILTQPWRARFERVGEEAAARLPLGMAARVYREAER